MSHPDAIRTMNELRYHANAKHSRASTISRMRKFRSGSCTEVAAATDQAINLRRPPLDDIADEGGYLSRAVLFTTWMMQISRLPRALEYGLPLSRAAWMPASINEVLLHMQPASKLPASLHVDFSKDVTALHLTPKSTCEALLPRY